MIKGTIICLFVLALVACNENKTKAKFITSKFSEDNKKYKLRERAYSPINKEFIAKFYEDKGATGAGKVLKLYSPDSTSIDEVYYGEHPLKVLHWSDSIIQLEASITLDGQDSTYNKWYLKNSVDKNVKIGRYRLHYLKTYKMNEKILQRTTTASMQ